MLTNILKSRNIRLVVAGITVVVLISIVFFSGAAASIGKVFGSTGETSSVFDPSKGIVSQGTIEAKEVSINSKIPGKIVKLYIEEGKQVKAGDLLVEISSDEIQAKKDQAAALVEAAQAGYDAAKAQLDAANAQAQKAENGARQQEVTQAQTAYDLAVKSLQRVEELYKSKREQVLAQIELAKSTSEKAQNGARAQEIAQAQAAYDLWSNTYARTQKLYEKGAISTQKRDEIKTQMDVASQTLSLAKEGARQEDKAAAQALLSQAQAGLSEVDDTFALKIDEAEAQVNIRWETLSMAKEGARSEDKNGAQALVAQAMAGEQAALAKLEQAKGGLQEVEAYLKDTKITAPMDGTVTVVTADEGELVSSGMSIATIGNLGSMWIEVKVKETDMNKITYGQAVNVKIPAYKDKVFTGKVTTINKKPDFATKRATNDNGSFDIVSFGIKVELQDNKENLYPGMSAFVQFTAQ